MQNRNCSLFLFPDNIATASINLFDISCVAQTESRTRGEVCQLYVLRSRNPTLCLLTVSSLRVLGIMKARVGKTISLHAKHEVGNSGLSVPGPDDEWCNYSRVRWRESVSADSITHSHVLYMHTRLQTPLWKPGTERLSACEFVRKDTEFLEQMFCI